MSAAEKLILAELEAIKEQQRQLLQLVGSLLPKNGVDIGEIKELAAKVAKHGPGVLKLYNERKKKQ